MGALLSEGNHFIPPELLPSCLNLYCYTFFCLHSLRVQIKDNSIHSVSQATLNHSLVYRHQHLKHRSIEVCTKQPL